MASLTASERDDPPLRRKSCEASPVAENTGLGSFDPSCLDMLDDILPADDLTDSLYQDSLDIESSLPNFGTDDNLSSFGRDSRFSLTAQDALKTSQLVAAPQVGRVLTSRLQYAMDKIMTAPSQMVSMNQMPWCHAHLYDEGMPRSMQHAVSSAALHAAKNHLNARVIRENIECRVQDLLSSPSATTPLETLAYAQALFMYQTLRLDDTDPRARYTYEATMSHLEEAAHALIPLINFGESWYTDSSNRDLDLVPLYPSSAAHNFWSVWILQESMRRTLAIVNLFVVTYYYLKGENRCSQNIIGPYDGEAKEC
ncbi:unnamed protein product [Fusarium equiseti]|uniref:Uncharacterized protein n=1 Tax=Fusarium equiseti TaxID=61235 RepID=A0A8J2IQV4_FUSEQ|nr:unnamed protein product [Fusarium equiseti]